MGRFLAGRSSLKSVELELLGDVQNLRILHLHCHIGLDSMSLSRMGAQVTAVDFSGKSIEVAQLIQRQAGSNVDFLVKDIGFLQENELGEFDIVYATYGLLPWIDDLGSGLIGHSQKMTEAASAMAEKKTFGHQS